MNTIVCCRLYYMRANGNICIIHALLEHDRLRITKVTTCHFYFNGPGFYFLRLLLLHSRSTIEIKLSFSDSKTKRKNLERAFESCCSTPRVLKRWRKTHGYHQVSTFLLLLLFFIFILFFFFSSLGIYYVCITRCAMHKLTRNIFYLAAAKVLFYACVFSERKKRREERENKKK